MDILHTDTPDGWMGIDPIRSNIVKVSYEYQESLGWSDTWVKLMINKLLIDMHNSDIDETEITWGLRS